jgi:hypothetical protein
LTVEELLISVRRRIRDEHKIEYQDSELIDYINDAINLVSNTAIASKDPLMIKEITVTGSIGVPEFFVKLAGVYPVSIFNGIINLLNPAETIVCKYYAAKNNIASLSDEIPFDGANCSLVGQLTAIYALNRNQYDVSQDERLTNTLSQAIVLGKTKVRE